MVEDLSYFLNVNDCRGVTFSKQNDDRAKQAEKILKSTAQSEGYALCFGLKDGRLIEELARQSKLTIIAMDPESSENVIFSR